VLHLVFAVDARYESTVTGRNKTGNLVEKGVPKVWKSTRI
jgi:hypothetical protein